MFIPVTNVRLLGDTDYYSLCHGILDYYYLNSNYGVCINQLSQHLTTNDEDLSPFFMLKINK